MEENKQEKQKVPFYKKWWFWLIIGVVVLGIIGSVVGGTSGGSSTNNSGNNSGQVASTYGMNQTVKVGDLEYTIKNAYDTVKVGTLGDVTQNNYVVITLNIKNNGSSEKTFTSSSFTYYRGNNKYEPSTQAIYLSGASNPFSVIETIGAGISKTITVVYEIPSAHQSTDYLQVKDSFRSEKIYMK